MTSVPDLYKNLYHYTTHEGVIGILKSQSLRATDYRDLNDEKEIRYFYENKFIDFVTPLIENIYTNYIYENEVHRDRFFKNKKSIKSVTKEDTRILIESLMKGIDDELFICSFAGENKDQNINNHGLLSQWRAYGTDGGYCLVFDASKLAKKKMSRNSNLLII